MIMIHKPAGRRQWVALAGVAALCAGVIGVVAFRVSRSPTPLLLRLVDGTEIYYLSNTTVTPSSGYPVTRELKIDGEVFVRVTAAAQPLIIRSRLLLLKVTGASALRVTARSNETGEEADVLYGHVEATKAYPSKQSDTDTLLTGEEVMVNETIDLQEKETADVPRLRAWSDALVASVNRANAR